MIRTNSGCFGRSGVVDTIDDTTETAQAVEDIVEGMQPSGNTDAANPTVFALSMVYNRLRMLTWAVVLIALYLVIKESK